MTCQYRKFHCGDKTAMRLSYDHKGISCTTKTAYLYWIGPSSSPSVDNGMLHPNVLVSGDLFTHIIQDYSMDTKVIIRLHQSVSLDLVSHLHHFKRSELDYQASRSRHFAKQRLRNISRDGPNMCCRLGGYWTKPMITFKPAPVTWNQTYHLEFCTCLVHS